MKHYDIEDGRILRKRTRIWGVVAAVVLILAASAVALGIGLSQAKQEAELKYDSGEEALSAFLSEIAGKTLTSAEEETRNLGPVLKNDTEVYYALTEPSPDGALGPARFYVAVVRESEGRYGAFKVTSEFSLGPANADETGYIPEYQFGQFTDVDGYAIGFGRILDGETIPYSGGSPLAVREDGLFVCVSWGAPCDVEFITP